MSTLLLLTTPGPLTQDTKLREMECAGGPHPSNLLPLASARSQALAFFFFFFKFS